MGETATAETAMGYAAAVGNKKLRNCGVFEDKALLAKSGEARAYSTRSLGISGLNADHTRPDSLPYLRTANTTSSCLPASA